LNGAGPDPVKAKIVKVIPALPNHAGMPGRAIIASMYTRTLADKLLKGKPNVSAASQHGFKHFRSSRYKYIFSH
jgi:hypothetical protein